MSHIAWGSLTCGNGALAYRVANLGKEVDERLTNIVLEPHFAAPAQQVIALRSHLYEVKKATPPILYQKKLTEESIGLWEQYNYAMQHPETWGSYTPSVTNSHTGVCQHCNGTGRISTGGGGQKLCPFCNGTGKETHSHTSLGVTTAVPPSPPNLAKSLDMFRQDLGGINNTLAKIQADIDKTQADIDANVKVLFTLCPAMIQKVFPPPPTQQADGTK